MDYYYGASELLFVITSTGEVITSKDKRHSINESKLSQITGFSYKNLTEHSRMKILL